MNITNHIAILVPSVDNSARVFSQDGYAVGPKETWDGEGTAEIYVGEPGHSSRLLLMEPVKPGAYRRAMESRGPGLHHIAIDVKDLDAFVRSLEGSGWYLTPSTLRTFQKTKTAWLARPGTKMLIEVQQRSELNDAPKFISKLEVPLTAKELAMVAALNTDTIVQSGCNNSWLAIGDHRISIAKVIEGR